MAARGRVTVYGTDIRKPPLLDSSDAQMVIIRDAFGDPMIVMVRILSDDTWGLVTKNDPDWQGVLLRCGLADLKPGTTIKDVVAAAPDLIRMKG